MPLLGAYLKEHGLGTFAYVLGHRPDGNHPDRQPFSHAWLRQDDIVVDITADQFDDAPASVIVATDSPWHKAFDGQVQHEADYRVFDGYAGASLEAAYETISKIADR